MKFTRMRLDGAYIIDTELHEDERGSFARTYCRNEFAREGLPTEFVQCNVSFTRRRATLRGMHYQDDPFPEGKLVRCSRGTIYDVIIDLRTNSPTYCQWAGIELSDVNARAIYIPPGFAHGFQTITDDAQVLYQMTQAYHPDLARGVRWNDPTFGITWPLQDPFISPRDAAFPNFLPTPRNS
jgi:dTDP-4-dehydrorhamnose 3,5-epimerase